MTIAQQLHVSVLSAPVAAADRRALSQAWYSALYSAKAAPRSKAAPRNLQPLPHAGKHAAGVSASSAPQRSRANPQPSATRRNASIAQPAAERRAERSALARKIESVFLRPGIPVSSATFTLGEEGRIRISLRRDGDTVRLIAVCAPRVRKEVAQALAQARYALAQRGVTLLSEIEESAQ